MYFFTFLFKFLNFALYLPPGAARQPLSAAKTRYMQKKNIAKEKILQVAKELFEHFGYEKTTIEGICRRTGKAKTSVYYYYDGKQALLKDIVEQEFAEVREQLTPHRVISEKVTASNLKTYLKERMKLIIGMRVYPQFIISQYSEPDNEACGTIRAVRDEFDSWERDYFYRVCSYGRLNNILKDDIKPDAFADMLIMLLKGIETQYIIYRDRDSIISTFNAMVDFLIRDIVVPPEREAASLAALAGIAAAGTASPDASDDNDNKK